jgi:glycosyltransferase involved in cell wall biosynthesis
VVSSLRRTGPTQQLFNIIRFLKDNEITIITLSQEPSDSLLHDFDRLNVEIVPLNLSRISGFFIAKKMITHHINFSKPDIVHTQGVRADNILSKISNGGFCWVSTIRNVPTIDYPAKFGNIVGNLMSYNHVSAIKKCPNLVACSNSVKHAIRQLGVKSIAIQNGVHMHDIADETNSLFADYSKPVFVTVGSLISRKNVLETINAFKKYKQKHHGTGTLLIVGDGPERTKLKSCAVDGVVFLGHCDQVRQILLLSDYFVSSSLSEGLPNAVLEAMSCGLPVVLSDIASHREIQKEAQQSVKIYKNENPIAHLAELMSNIGEEFHQDSGKLSREVAIEKFSAQAMSTAYQRFYSELLINDAV